MGNTGKNLFLWIILFVLFMVAYNLIQGELGVGSTTNIPFSKFIDEVNAGQVREVVIQGKEIIGKYSNGASFTTYSVEYPDLVNVLKDHNVTITASPPESNPFWGILLSFGPILLLIAVWIFFMKQMQSGSGKAMGFGKSRARLMTDKGEKVTFEDVAGIDEAKEELSEIVDYLKDPHKFQRLGGKIPKGCLLIGSPGTGKTLLARSIAGEAEVPFFTISGSDFVEMFVGVGASRVRDMFEQGKKNAPCLIFIDEIDAVGRHRGAGLGGGNDEREQTLNQLLVEMDGFTSNEGVILLAATNRPDVLDPALLRPGRFDRQIVVPLPDINGREKILAVHLKKIAMAPNVDPRIIARGTPGFSGADLANLVNESALLAARKNKKVVTMKDLEAAKDKVMMGAERRSMVMSDDEKKLTAYHESGHAIVSLHCPSSDPIHKATIIPRGQALGLVMRLPETDRLSVSRQKLEADMTVAMGGRVAEEIIFGYDKVTSGASSDFKQATKMARSMVEEWGMSDEMGTVYYGSDQQEVFLGHSLAQQRSISEESVKNIDKEVKSLIDTCYNNAKKILNDNINELHSLAKALLEYETLSGDEIKDLLAGKPIKHPAESNNLKEAVRKSSLPQTAKKPDNDDNKETK